MKWTKPFIYSAGGIVLTAALMRFAIAIENAPILTQPEPMLGIPLRYAVLVIGTIELLVALVCLFGKQVNLQLAWLAWLSTDWIIFWIALLAVHCHPQATCIGSLTDPLHFSRGAIDLVAGILPFYLLLGSYSAMTCVWLENRSARAARFLKMSCPACGVHIRFAEQNLSQKISCPYCQKTITLRNPGLLKMVCFFCKEHIEFPAHAIGEKIPCPHCKFDITLKEPT